MGGDARNENDLAQRVTNLEEDFNEQYAIMKAVVTDVLYDPDAIFEDEDQLTDLSNRLQNSRWLIDAPRNSIIVRIISDNHYKETLKEQLCFPFFPPHISLPVKVGEQVWIVNEVIEKLEAVSYWISRVPEGRSIDDVNYTHGDRKHIMGVALDAQGKANKEKVQTAQFPNGTGAQGKKTFSTDQDGLENDYYNIVFEHSLTAPVWTPQVVPRFTKRPGDLVLQGSNNTLISLGEDRLWTPMNASSIGKTSNVHNAEFFDEDWRNDSAPKDPERYAGTIDLVAGRYVDPDGKPDAKAKSGTTTPTITKNSRNLQETNKDSIGSQVDANPSEGDPHAWLDASRIYISQHTNVDNNFNIQVRNGRGQYAEAQRARGLGQVGDKLPPLPVPEWPVEPGPTIVLRTDHARIIARKDFKICVGEDPGTGETPTKIGASITLRADGEIIITPGDGGVIRLGGDDAAMAVLCSQGLNTNGHVEGMPTISTAGGTMGVGHGTGVFACKVLVK